MKRVVFQGQIRVCLTDNMRDEAARAAAAEGEMVSGVVRQRSRMAGEPHSAPRTSGGLGPHAGGRGTDGE